MAEQRGIGAEQADKVEGLMIGAGQAVGSKLQQWSAPQAGIHDDALRFAGNVGKAVLGNPLGSGALRILGAGGEAGGWVGGKVATKLGVDPRWGKWTGGFIGDAIGGGIAAKTLKAAKLGQVVKTVTKGPLDDALKISQQSNRVPLRQTLMEGADNLRQLSMSPHRQLAIAGGGGLKGRVDDFVSNNVFAFKKQPRTPEIQQLIDANRAYKPKGFNTNKWDNYVGKFGSREGAESAIKKAEESAKYLKKHGSLKGNNNIWTDPKTGESFVVKNKAKRGEISIGFDSVKSVEKTLANRIKGAKLNVDEIKKIADDLPGWDDAKVARYIKESEQAKRTLEALIRDLNKGEGRTMWSLGHRRAVKTQAHSADRITNIELEPLVDVLTEHGRKIKGNTGRAANDELSDILSKITNNPADLKADMIHWDDSLLGNFMPRMREITDAKTFFDEIIKREDFIARIKAYAKKNKVSLEEASDVVSRPLYKKYWKQDQPTFID
tara:strand:- start:436 stop:1917 length:1482 start_codon:yes stop_codon:yes gene_type:complete